MPKSIDISPEVEAVLARATVVDGNVVKLPDEQLDRALYTAVDKVLKALGGKWDRRAGGHVFNRGIGDALTAALTAGRAVDQRRTMEQFFTPPALADRVAHLAQIRAGHHVLEPEAGSGRLVLAALALGATVTAVELDRDLIGAGGKEGKGDGLLDIATRHHGDLFIFGADFMAWTPASRLPIDRVIMNPPFGKGADMAHVRRAFDFLRPGGRLVAIMSPHWTFAASSAAQEFRAFVKTRWGDWVELEPGTFKGEGTGVNAGLLILNKPAS
jgi:predicted RNA methylase